MKKLFRKAHVKLQYIKKALCKINKPKLGDTVVHNNVKCSLIQGVNKPFWDLLPLTKENLDKQKRDIFKRVHEDDFKLKPFLKRFRFSFMTTYKFLMRSWYGIDCRKTGKISYSW